MHTTNEHTPHLPKDRAAVTIRPSWAFPVILGAAALLGGALGFGAGHATAEPETIVETETVADASCGQAVDAADQVIDLYSQAFNHAADALTAYQAGQYTLMDDNTMAIETISEELSPVLVEFYENQMECDG